VDILIGHTGFVGSNLQAQHTFDGLFHSKNIADAFGLGPDLCVYCGVRAEKYLANAYPEADRAAALGAAENIEKIKPKVLVLISTVDVFPRPADVDEGSEIPINSQAYGANRRWLEQWVRGHVPRHHILRLPGLFGKNLKKNFLYDLLGGIPAMLNQETYGQLTAASPEIVKHYAPTGGGFYRRVPQGTAGDAAVKRCLDAVGFSAVNFTDSRSVFQFYDLSGLWAHIRIALEENIPLLHLAPEPVPAQEIYKAVKGADFINEIPGRPPAQYDFKTLYDKQFGGAGGYICGKRAVMEKILRFAKEWGTDGGA
jgi:hypothetical protein